MKRILYLATIIGLLFVTSACEQKKELYQLSDKVEASFPSTIANYQMVAADGNKIVIEMWRGNTNGAASVPVTITGTEGMFTPEKNQFDFADGEAKAYLALTYPDLNAFGGEKYDIEITIDDENQVSPTGNETITISVQRKLTFKSIGTGTFTSEWFEESWPQEVLKAEEGDYYRLPDCYYKGFPIEFSLSDGKINFGLQPTGWKTSYGIVNWDPRYVDECEVNGKTLVFVVRWSVPAGSFGTSVEVLEMP